MNFKKIKTFSVKYACVIEKKFCSKEKQVQIILRFNEYSSFFDFSVKCVKMKGWFFSAKKKNGNETEGTEDLCK